VRTQNHDPDTGGRGCRGRKKEGQRPNEIQGEEERESGGGKEGAMGAAVGGGRGKSIEDTAVGSKSEHTTGLS